MAMSWPGTIPGGELRRKVGSHLDLLPTILTAAGVSVPADRTLDGFDALPMATTGAASRHDAIFWSSDGQLAVRRGAWKLVRNGKTFDGTPQGSQPLPGDDALFLSNLEEDPGESRNLRHQNPALADELLTLAEKWLADVQKP